MACSVVSDSGGGGTSVMVRTVSPVFLMLLLLHRRQFFAVCFLNSVGFGFLDPGWPFCPPGSLAAPPAGFLARAALFLRDFSAFPDRVLCEGGACGPPSCAVARLRASGDGAATRPPAAARGYSAGPSCAVQADPWPQFMHRRHLYAYQSIF